MPAARPPGSTAALNDQFRQTIGRRGGLGGHVEFDSSMNDVAIHTRRRIIAKIRDFAFQNDDISDRSTAVLTVSSRRYRFQITRPASNPTGEGVLTISRA